jgi:hypothetical protein
MSYKKMLLIVGLAAIFLTMSLGSQAYAGGGIDPPAWCTTIQGPELWGVVIMDNASGASTLRVKRIVDCNVETFASVDPTWPADFPDDAGDPIHWAFQGVSFFSDISGSAIITKVKNFQTDGTVISFDAQFKFCGP